MAFIKCACCVDDPTDVMIGMGEKARKTFHESCGNWSVPLWIVVPCRDLVRTCCVSRTGRNHPEFELTFVNGLTQRIPALIEFPSEPIDPVSWRMMRGVNGGGREITEPRTVRSRRPLPLKPLDRSVGKIFGEVVAGSTFVRRKWCGLVIDGRLPLGSFGADNAVEPIEAEPGWPTIERP